MERDRPIRVLLAKVGLDGHNRGIQLVARALRNAGMEVIFLGLRVSPQQIVRSAIQEDVDVIGLSVFSGGLMTIVPKTFKALQESRAADIPVIVGGILPPEDAASLKAMGIREVCGPGTDPEDIIRSIQGIVARRA
ncbi:MAG: cobalamin B12-binding domain-containing protein [bacterium]